mmetsp:Transcript_20604/g.49416  ORF Transcript_20604/g.49416 Transcript_20604/m.49416 type:complete len:120 (-) Transcript_20604:189-548(-)|eukprot:CAMPEP_0182823698 /NCGR_PEP_ID=MMETSP0006_2-20121128/14892_1 /TAXON_ID=97485 /ORGANISM="Prymnesium parvum, Strain Texoma1" /LENGTH=119 /DNA_ID=CAMNT_0024950639 /DNA_START=139 /DNA_END=498 /DNA_ORIENTATION=-
MVAEARWFTVKYGDDESQPFNSDCWAVVLLDHIKKQCGFAAASEEFDLLQMDGTRLNLATLGRQSARTAITPKGAYILAKIVVDENGTQTVEKLWTPPPGYEPPVPIPASKGSPAKGKK